MSVSDLGEEKKKSFFLLYLSQVVSFCSSLATNSCLRLELFRTGERPGAPVKVKSPRLRRLQGFSARAVFTRGMLGAEGENRRWLVCPVARGSVAAHF